MELSSDIAYLLQLLNANPGWMLAAAGLGGFPFLIVFVILSGLARLFGIYKATYNFFAVVFSILLITWMPGFLMIGLLLALGISGVKMLFLWLLMLCMAFIFCVTRYRSINAYVENLTKKNF